MADVVHLKVVDTGSGLRTEFAKTAVEVFDAFVAQKGREPHGLYIVLADVSGGATGGRMISEEGRPFEAALDMLAVDRMAAFVQE